MKKAFASAVFAGLGVLLIVFLIGVLAVKQDGAENALLQSRLVADKHSDGRGFISGAMNDAILDGAWDAYCDTPSGSFCPAFSSRYPSYRTASLALLDDQAAGVELAPAAATCSGSSPSFTVGDSSVLTAFSVNPSNAFKKTLALGLSKSVSITQAGSSITISISTAAGVEKSVTRPCP